LHPTLNDQYLTSIRKAQSRRKRTTRPPTSERSRIYRNKNEQPAHRPRRGRAFAETNEQSPPFTTSEQSRICQKNKKALPAITERAKGKYKCLFSRKDGALNRTILFLELLRQGSLATYHADYIITRCKASHFHVEHHVFSRQHPCLHQAAREIV